MFHSTIYQRSFLMTLRSRLVRGRGLLVAALVGAVCLAGCGGDDNPSSGNTNGGNNNGGNINGGGGGSGEYVELGGLKWMKKNLNVETANSWCYGNSPDSCTKYGRLYTWEAARTACPSGWRLPSRDEWGALTIAAGGTGAYGTGGTAGRKLKSTTGWNYYYSDSYYGTDDYNFTALPGGGRYSDGSFYNAGNFGLWWVATEYGSGFAYRRSMFYEDDVVNEEALNKVNAFSVRCVRD
jgi:uncharacterized protein (TIGR02145 family)